MIQPLVMPRASSRARSYDSSDDRDVSQASSAWLRWLPDHDVKAASEAFSSNLLNVPRQVSAILRPRSVEQVIDIVRIAREQGVPLYPISRGRNWGYGSALPVTDNCAVLDCSGMDRISEFDPELGLVTVEPGVTQRQLDVFLREQGASWIVPTSGAGPEVSILGNALERGYGLAPHTDHFGAVTAFEAVLADGRVYRSALTELGGEAVDKAFKWGIGPYLDGLLTQSNFAVVTKATIALARRPEQVAALMFRVDDESGLPAAIEVVREVLQQYGSVIQAINLMNGRRVLSMAEPYPHDAVGPDGILPEAVVDRLTRAYGLGAWTGFGALAGPASLVRAAKRGIVRMLRGRVRQVRFLTLPTVRFARCVIDRLPARMLPRTRRQVASLEKALLNVSGVPSEVALPLCYWLSGKQPTPGEPINPARDRCGLIWYAPLVPMKPETVLAYTRYVREVCTAHGIEPLITLTSVSDRCFDSTVPLLFQPEQPGATERAHACFDALFDRGQSQGLLPYRCSVTAMDKIIRPGTPYWDAVAAIKRALDPGHILSPGRYCPRPAEPGS
jgi:4-cresol dehydrogenase (hydroxylating)